MMLSKSENKLKEVDIYYKAKSNLKTRFKVQLHKLNSKNEATELIGRLDSEPYSRATNCISSTENSNIKTLFEYEIDDTLEIKEECVLDPDTAPDQKSNKKYESKVCTADIRDDIIIAVQNTLRTLKKQEIHDTDSETKYKCKKCAQKLNCKNEATELIGRVDSGPYSCATTCISSSENMNTKTLFEYEIDDTLEIKEELVLDPDTAIDQKSDEKYESKFCTVYIRDADALVVEKDLRTHKEQEIHDTDSEKKYKCEKCARRYKWKKHLNQHLKFECGVVPQFEYQKRKSESKISTEGTDVGPSSCTKTVNEYKCEKCSRSYTLKACLKIHQKYECDIRQIEANSDAANSTFIIDNHSDETLKIKKEVGHYQQSKKKSKKSKGGHGGPYSYTTYQDLSQQMDNIKYETVLLTVDKIEDDVLPASRQRRQKMQGSQESKQETGKKYKCEKCARVYKHKNSLTAHQKYDCNVIPQLKCNFCDKRFTKEYHLNDQQSKRKSKKTRRGYGIPYSFVTTDASDDYSDAVPLIKYERDATLEIKEEIIQDQDILPARKVRSQKTQTIKELKQENGNRYKCEKCARSYSAKTSLIRHQRYDCNVRPQFKCQQSKSKSKKYTRGHGGPYFYITTDISSDNYSDAMTIIEYDIDESLEIKEEIVQDQRSNCKSKKFSGIRRPDVTLDNNSDTKTSTCIIEYDNDETVEIKEEVTQDQRSECKSKKSRGLGRPDVTLDNNSDTKTLTCIIEYDNDETVEIKEEVIQDQETNKVKVQKPDEKYDPKVCITDIKKSAAMHVKKLRTKLAQKIKKSNPEKRSKLKQEIEESNSEQKYKCEKCACRYKWKKHLNQHLKFVCGVPPQFRYQRSECKSKKSRGLGRPDVTLDNNSDTKTLTCIIEYDNDETVEIKEEFIQDPETNDVKGQKPDENYDPKVCTADIRKSTSLNVKKLRTKLAQKIKKSIPEKRTKLKLEIEDSNSEQKYKCEKCARRYKWKKHLNQHLKFECGVTPQFRYPESKGVRVQNPDEEHDSKVSIVDLR
ncbi:zinc finger protein 189-like [Belonocnema kinseyi]|uniref:zinc finger protein 189-like n=1 Tax=Belonocnema kinseyi TaxID=2817044 RepID=UPI00143CFAAB|nr:zinc finger protein 189-like [Belonocnema kinseyi]